VVAVLLGDDGRAVGGQYLPGVVTDLVGNRAGADEAGGGLVDPAEG
jgi:hypothetical protein